MSHHTRRRAIAAGVAVILAAAPTTLLAASFYVQQQSVTGLGRAYAGETSQAADASTIHFNPAGMTRLRSGELQAGLHVLAPKASVEQDSEGPIPGRDANNPYGTSPVPNLYWAEQYSDRVWLGFGLGAPFGLKNEYDDDFFARYDSLESDLRVLNLQPSIAVELSDRISVGGGIDLQYADVTLRSAIPDPDDPLNPATDGEFDLQGDSWDAGFNLGVLVDLSEQTRLGMHYRSRVTHRLRGTATTTFPENADERQMFGDTFVESGQAELHLPDIASVGISHRFDHRFTAMVRYSWFNWSRFDAIEIELANDELTLDQNYRNSHTLALGAEYRLDPFWTMRSGVQYDCTPTQTDGRSTRTPDGDRTWVAFGASYATGARWAFDLAYAYVNVSRESLDITREFNGQPVTMQGTSDGRVHILSAAMRYHF